MTAQFAAPLVARVASTATEQAVAATAAPGRELEPRVRRTMEGELGRSFAGVRVHTDTAAAAAAERLDADAFTLGNHVVFGPDRYSPGTPRGDDLLHHELVHVAQQEGAAPSGRVAVGEAHSTMEGDARRGAVGARPDVQLIQRQPHGGGQRGHISAITINQGPPSQTIAWTGVNGYASGSARCSTGKGHCCCTDPALPACTHNGSHADGSNLTPEGRFTVASKVIDHKGIPFWTEFVPARAIAMHEYSPVDGTPLSHGCVRLDSANAEQIFHGAIPGRTVVNVVGLPSPQCANAKLQDEWADDFNKVQANDGEETRAFMSTFGTDRAGAAAEAAAAGTPATTASVASRIPRCLGNLETHEEQELSAAPTGAAPATPGLTGFRRSLRNAQTIAAARTVVTSFGHDLWNSARNRAQARRGADFDDRPLYWGRLRAQQAVKAWDPPNPDERRRGIPELLRMLEDSSRGYDTSSFPSPSTRPGAPAALKRVVVSGFDPFGGSMGSVDQSNPSASAVLLLDGQTIGTAPSRARVEGAIFPVRFQDFDEGVVERVLGPLILGPPPADLVVSISRGGSDFELEEWAGGHRSNRLPDNAGVVGNTTPSANSEAAAAGPIIPGAGANQEAFHTSVPTTTLTAMRGGRATPNSNEIKLKEANAQGGTDFRTAPTGKHLVAEGSGGGYLSNEIFYRNRRLAGAKTTIPIVHLHVPTLDGIDPAAERQAIAQKARQIIEAALPTLP